MPVRDLRVPLPLADDVRRGRATKPHPTMRHGLVSARIIARLLVVSEVTVWRRLEPRACDVATRALLYDAAEAAARWQPRPQDDAA